MASQYIQQLDAITSVVGTYVIPISDTPAGTGRLKKITVANLLSGLTISSTTGTFTLTNGKTFSISNTLTLAGTDGSTLNIGGGGTLGTAAYTAASAYEVPLTFSTGLTRSTNTITVNTSQNIATLSNLTSNGLVTTSGGNGTLGISTLDTDGTLAANSDTRVATQKAVKTYVDTSVTGLLEFKGSTDCSANPNYPSANKGDAYYVSVAGKIGGASGTSVEVGDVYVASADNAGGTQASVGTSWFIMEHNLVGAAVTSGTLAQFAATTSAQLAGVISDETGTGALVFATSPALVTPNLGTPSACVITNFSGTGSINVNGTVGATTPTTGVFTTVKAIAAATQDSIILQGRAGGSTDYSVTFIPATLSASRTITVPDATGTLVLGGGTCSGTSSGINTGDQTITLTGPITSVGNATSIASQTGTGTKFVVDTAPTLVTSVTVPLIIGGTGTTSTLTLKPTSGVGTTNADIIFQVGNNGATEAARITNAGNTGIGTGATVSAKTHIINTTEQLRVGYDVSNYFTTTVNSVGTVLFGRAGGTPANGSGSYIFSEEINATGLISGYNYITNSKALLKFLAVYDRDIGLGTYLVADYFENGCAISSEYGGRLALGKDNTVVTSGDMIGKISFLSNDVTLASYNPAPVAEIKVVASQSYSTDAAPGDMIFSTTGTTVGGTLVERIRITGSGRVGIGTSSPSHPFHLTVSSPTSVATSIGTNSNYLSTFFGAIGGATTIATTGTGGDGSHIFFASGGGGTAASALTSSTGGDAGLFLVNVNTSVTFGTYGVGGAAAVDGTGSNVGGAGSKIYIYGGSGGAATGNTTGNNTGGPGGSVTIAAGTGGAASNANGAPGVIRGGAGGNFTISAGVGGAGTGGTAGDGGDLILRTATTVTITERMRVLHSGEVGIGTSTPASLLDIASTTGGILTLRRVDTSVTANDMVGKLQFYTADTSSTTNFVIADIEAQATNTIATDINPGRMIFRTTGTGVGTSPVEAFQIDNAQNIGIGTGNTVSARTHIVSTTEQLRVGYDASNYYKTTVSSTGGVTFDAVGSGAGFIFSDSITSSSATAGIGYTAGAGGTVTQATSKSTGCTLSKCGGSITMNNAALAAATIVSFVLTNTAITATDVLVLNHISGGTPGAYTLNARCGSGTATIDVRNNTAGSLSEAIVIQFALIKSSNI